jgi:hypothetical protein
MAILKKEFWAQFQLTESILKFKIEINPYQNVIELAHLTNNFNYSTENDFTKSNQTNT